MIFVFVRLLLWNICEGIFVVRNQFVNSVGDGCGGVVPHDYGMLHVSHRSASVIISDKYYHQTLALKHEP